MNLKFGDYIKSLREQLDLSQEFVAGKIGMSRPTFILVEKGERELTITEAKKMAALFGLSLEDFLNKLEKKDTKVIIKKAEKDKVLEEQDEISIEEKKFFKFKEVLLYILEKVGAKPNIGETALYKLLYFIDFDFFEKFNKKLIGATYTKNHFGPTPVEFITVIKDMKEKGELEQVKSTYFQYEQKKYLPLRSPDFTILSDSLELKHIDDVLCRFSEKSGRELSDYSHGDIPWLATPDQDVIDYNLVFQRSTPYAQRNHEEDLLDISLEDAFNDLPETTLDEYEYYMSLPDKK